MGIVVIGAVFIDVKGYPLANYIPNGRNVGRVEQIHGGVGRNVAENLANMELRPTFVSLVDDNDQGENVIKKLKRHKINTEYVRSVKDGMGTWLAVFDNDGDVAASISKRPDLSPILTILEEQGDEIFRDADGVVVEIDIDRDICNKVFSLAKKYDTKVYAIVSNMSIAIQRRDLLQRVECFVCNKQEAGILFFEDYDTVKPDEMEQILKEKIQMAKIPKMIVTMGGDGAVYADLEGNSGKCPGKKVEVVDTTGAGDAFFSGVTAGLAYGKTMKEACEIGTKLASSVICTSENVCPRFLPSEFGLKI